MYGSRWCSTARIPGPSRFVDGQLMVLRHGFIKKTQKIPQKEITTAKSRLRRYQEAES